jgi:hypothetical protein
MVVHDKQEGERPPAFLFVALKKIAPKKIALKKLPLKKLP